MVGSAAKEENLMEFGYYSDDNVNSQQINQKTKQKRPFKVFFGHL